MVMFVSLTLNKMRGIKRVRVDEEKRNIYVLFNQMMDENSVFQSRFGFLTPLVGLRKFIILKFSFKETVRDQSL